MDRWAIRVRVTHLFNETFLSEPGTNQSGFVLERARLYAKLRRSNLIGVAARMEPETVQVTPAKHGADQVAAGVPAELRLTRAQWLVLIAAFLGWLFDGFEIGLFPVIARPALKDMFGAGGDALGGDWMGRITAAFLVGAALGGGVFGWLGDRIGRVRALTLSILTYSIFSGAGYLAQAPWHLAVFRFLAAIGMGGEWAVGVALVMECWPDKHRPWLAGTIGAAANIGI